MYLLMKNKQYGFIDKICNTEMLNATFTQSEDIDHAGKYKISMVFRGYAFAHFLYFVADNLTIEKATKYLDKIHEWSQSLNTNHIAIVNRNSDGLVFRKYPANNVVINKVISLKNVAQVVLNYDDIDPSIDFLYDDLNESRKAGKIRTIYDTKEEAKSYFDKIVNNMYSRTHSNMVELTVNISL